MIRGLRSVDHGEGRDGVQRIVFAVVLFFLGLGFPLVVTTRDLDPSWSASLAYFFSHGMQAGADYVFTYGPLAMGAFDRDIFWAQYLWEITFSAAAAHVLASLILRIPSLLLRLLFLFLLAGAITTQETRYFVFIVAVGVQVALAEEVSVARLAAAMTSLAVVSCIKFTYFALSLGVVLVLPFATEWRRYPARVVLPLTLFVLAYLTTWVLLGQSLGNVPAYLSGSLEIARGYSEAMALIGDSAQNRLVVQLHVLLLAFLATRLDLLMHRRTRVALLIVVLGLAMAWKQSFVRQDAGHVLAYFAFVSLCPLFVLALGRPARRGIAALSSALLVICVASTIGAYQHVALGEPDYGGWIARIHGRFEANAPCLVNPVGCRDSRADQVDAARKRWRLPRIAAAVGDSTVDVVSHDQLALLANDLNWRPRPVFQSYTAYTAALASLNGAFYRSERAPRFVMVRLDTIDGRFPQEDDGQVLLELIRRYRPVLQEDSFLLVERRRPAELGGGEPVVLVRASMRFGEKLQLPATPGTYLTLEANMRYTPLGRLRRLFFRAPAVALRARVSNGEEKTYRVIPDLLRTESLLSPLMEWNGDLLGIYAGDPPRELSWLQFGRTKAARAAFRDEIDVVVRQYPLPPAVRPRATRRAGNR